MLIPKVDFDPIWRLIKLQIPLFELSGKVNRKKCRALFGSAYRAEVGPSYSNIRWPNLGHRIYPKYTTDRWSHCTWQFLLRRRPFLHLPGPWSRRSGCSDLLPAPLLTSGVCARRHSPGWRKGCGVMAPLSTLSNKPRGPAYSLGGRLKSVEAGMSPGPGSPLNLTRHPAPTPTQPSA